LDLDEESNKELLKSEILSYLLMKSNLYYVGILATTILVLSGPASFATTTTDPTQLTETTTDQTETSTEGNIRVSIGEGSNATVQYYTFTPQSVEINAGESVTWFSPSEISDIHTVTFVQDPSIVSDIVLPFAAPSGGITNLELLPPFNLGEPLIIEAPDGTEAIVALNKHAWYPVVLGANNQTTFLEGTDIQTTLNSSVKLINSGIIVPPLLPIGEDDQNRTAAGAAEIPPEAATNETTTMSNATTETADISPVPDEEGTIPQATEGATGEQILGPPFPPVSSFTVMFEEPGTYSYFCAIHPWMTGQVVVRGEAPTETEPEPQLEPEPEPQLEPEPEPETETEPEPEPQNQTEPQGPGELESPNPIFG
jgi:plastocyanin